MNLWADFDNQQTLSAEETARHKQRGRLTEQAILSSLRSWLVADYLPGYCRALAAMRFYRHCYWVDAWGVNTRANTASATMATAPPKGRKKEEAQPFSPTLQPLVALSTSLAQENRPLALHGIVLAAGSSTRKDGKAQDLDNTANGANAPLSAGAENGKVLLPKESGTLRASWLEVGSTLLKEIDQSPSIFLLNPFGATIFRYEHLAPLYQRTAPTELCLLMPHKQIEAHVLTAFRAPPVAALLTALLRTDRWKVLWPNGEATSNSLANLIDLLLASMQQYFLSVQRIALPIQTGPGLIEASPFTLLFATRSKDSLACMNDALYVRHRHLAEQSYRGTLGEDWFVAQQQARDAQHLERVRQRILQVGRAQRIQRWPTLRQQLLTTNFGQCTLRSYDELIVELIRAGTVPCAWRGRPPTNMHEEARVPGNDDTLLWQ